MTTMITTPTLEDIQSWDKKSLRARLTEDVKQWLAQGNEIQRSEPAVNCRNSRRVEVHGTGHYY